MADPRSNEPRAEPIQRLQRLKDRAAVVPLAGFVLLMPPVMPLFGGTADVFGVPLLYAYVFIVWIVLILAGRWIARSLQNAAREDVPGARGAPGEPPDRGAR